MSSLTPLRTLARAARPSAARHLVVARPISTTALRQYAYKDDQDRESVKPKAHEYTTSGTDDQAAANEDAAFNPNKTRPEAEKNKAGEGGDNPLEFSPANKEVAKGGQGKQEDKSKQGKQKQSGAGSGKKSG